MNRSRKVTALRAISCLAVLVALLSLFLSGCAQRSLSVKSVDMLSTPNLLVEADTAFKAKRYEAAELYYTKLLERQDLVKSELPVIYGRLADSAFVLGHYHQSRIALENWANMDTSALGKSSWEITYLDTMAALDKTERLDNHLKWLIKSVNLPWETRQDTAMWYSAYFMKRDDAEGALDVLHSFYAQAPDLTARSALEQVFNQRLEQLDESDVNKLSSVVTAANQLQFPYALVAFEHGARLAGDKDAWSVNWRTLRNVSVSGELADLIPLQTRLAELESRYGMPRIGVALALPLTGPYGSVGVKILRGAGLAQWRLAQDGTEVDIKVVNTSSPNWEKKLAALPDYYTVVGGPLQVSAFKRLYQGAPAGQRVLDKRAVFSFLASMGELEEGKDAWRFFSSRVDEVRSLVKLAVDQLGIKNLAVFYPEEKFGRTMARTFYNEAAPLGGRIRGMQGYPADDLKKWGKSVGKLLKVPANFSDIKDEPLTPPDFGAVFLPDGWRQAQTLLPNFFFYEGDQLLFLGPGLWSRSLDGAKGIDEHYYRLAVCPGAWWAASEGGHALQIALTDEGLGQADFWVALGYDFVRFAGRLGSLPADWTPEDVNKRIQKAQKMDFSMARLTWDAQGVASQDLFLFSPVQNGKELVDADKIAARIARAKARRERRIEAYEKRMEEEKNK
ncbi:hypothetical protein [Pseudodesulfovibrio sp.]|uniref:hypothetical protein n=1 Tax=unclassified Pseudodesulfovibrio TaxID=2661612 RepID=UPI003B006D19